MSQSVKLALFVSFGVAFVFGTVVVLRRSPGTNPNDAKPARTITFNKDIAPIVFRHCAVCHRPGQAAPFSLLDYAQVKRHAEQIAEVTRKRIMPPWLPEPGSGEFLNARTLTAVEIDRIQQWVATGAQEGNASDLPLIPQWSEGWQLGEPDLVVSMDEPYVLPPEGKDVYRNFVAAVPLRARRYVKAFEFRPGNAKIVHHAFVRFDQTDASRKLDEQDSEPGFSGVHTPISARGPEGHFSSWQPGKVPSAAEDLTWPLNPGTDLVLQLHMQPTGKPESIQAAVGFYFSEKPPAKILAKIRLTSFDIDIPPGSKDYSVKDSYVLPVDMDVLGILPHAHFLGKRLEGSAVLPDGTKRPLLLIREWNFNWQGDYRYAQPVRLPKGTTVTMNFGYDNSHENARNPHSPPERVGYGLQSTDEMAELWLQVAFRDENDRQIFARDYQVKVAKEVIAYNNFLLRTNPKDPKAFLEIGKAMVTLRRDEEAQTHLRKALELQAGLDEAHYFLGLSFRLQKRLGEARTEFSNALKINSQNAKAQGNLGIVCLELGDLDAAETSFKNALRLDPNDSIAFESLREIAKLRESRGPKP